MQVVRLLKTGN